MGNLLVNFVYFKGRKAKNAHGFLAVLVAESFMLVQCTGSDSVLNLNHALRL